MEVPLSQFIDSGWTWQWYNRDWFLQSNRAAKSWSRGGTSSVRAEDRAWYFQRQLLVGLDSAVSGGVSTVAVLRQGFRTLVTARMQTPMSQSVRKSIANSELQYIDRLTNVGFVSLLISGSTQLVDCVTTVSVYTAGWSTTPSLLREDAHSQSVQMCRGATSFCQFDEPSNPHHSISPFGAIKTSSSV